MSDQAEVKDIQTCILNIYKAIQKIYEKHGIRYYAIGVTCIGAVRHQGFIPWDDDLDIAMPDDDYYRFYKIAKTELAPYYQVYFGREKRCDMTFFMKVQDMRTTFVESREVGHYESYKGIFVDIMPLFGIPENDKEKYIKKIKHYHDMNTKRRFYLKGTEPFITKCISRIVAFFPQNYWCEKWDNFVRKYRFCDSKFTGYTWSGKLSDKTIFDTSWFGSYEEFPFEDTYIRCPKGWHACLSKQFGEYMKLPPENEREVHRDGGIVSIGNPFEEYVKNI